MKYKTLKHKTIPNTYGVVRESTIWPTKTPELKSSSHTLDNFKVLDQEEYKDFFKQLEDYELVTVEVIDSQQALPSSTDKVFVGVKVEDELPEADGYYSCKTTDSQGVGLIHYHKNTGWQNGFYNDVVTHWLKEITISELFKNK